MKLNNGAYQNGKIIGINTKKYLKARIRTIKGKIKKSGYNSLSLQNRVKDFTGILNKFAPKWLEEVKGTADGAGIAANDLILLNCLPVDFYLNAGMNCTSFMKIGGKTNFLFKIRDERNWPQQFVIKKNRGVPRVQYGVDIGNLGVAHFFNEKCVGGINNTGSECHDISDGARLSDCHLNRLLAEKCSCLDDAPRILEKLMEANVVGGAGLDRGMIFLLADPNGGMVIECTSKDFSVKKIKKGLFTVSNHFQTEKAKKWLKKKDNKNTLTRKKRIDELLKVKNAKLTPEAIFELSRDRKYQPNSLCNDDKKHFWMTLSASLYIINNSNPRDSYQYFCCGNTRNSVYLPFRLSQEENSPPLISGDFYTATDKLYKKFGCGKHIEKIQVGFEKEMLGEVKNDIFNGELPQKAFKTIKSF